MRRLLAGALLPMVLTGCGVHGGGDQPSPAGSSSSSSGAVPSSGGTGDDRAHQVFSRKQLEAALPEAKDLGSGWAEGGREYLEAISDTSGVDPTECSALFMRGETWQRLKGRVVGYATRRYSKPEQEGTLALVELHSFEEPFPATAFDELREALPRCRTWTYGGSTWTTTPLSLPGYGDQGYGMSYSVDGDEDRHTDMAVFAVGRTVVAVHTSATGDRRPDVAVLRRAAQTTLTNLEEAP